MIPKVIHYVWLSDDEKPELISKCLRSWQLVLPEYEIREWKMKDFDIRSMPAFAREAIKKKKYAFATDYLRMYLLYEHGGLYFDSDIMMLKPFDNLPDSGFFSCIEFHEGGFKPFSHRINEKGEALTDKHIPGFCIQAAFLGAEKGHPFAKDCMEYYEKRHFEIHDEREGVTFLAPDIYAICARKYGFLYRNELQKIEGGITVFPSHHIAGCFEERDDRNYGIHCCAGSWRAKSPQGIRGRAKAIIKKAVRKFR